MFDRFDGDAVKAVKDGMDEAKKLRQTELKTEHLLIACAKVRDDTSAAMHKSGWCVTLCTKRNESSASVSQ